MTNPESVDHVQHRGLRPLLPPRGRDNRRGFALITSMIVLAVLALLGVSTMTATNTALQTAANLEDGNRSFQAAEAGITAAAMAVFSDPSQLAFVGDSTTLDFSAMNPNPVAHLGSDTPTVTAMVSGDPTGRCERSEFASSNDLIGCGAFDVISTHAPATSGQARNAARTSLRLGLSRQVIALD